MSNFYKPQKYPLNNAPRPPILIQRPSLSDSTLMLSEKPDKAAYKQKSITYEDEISKRSVLLPSPKFPKTVIFDLDETLVHCSKFVDPNDTVLKVKLPNHQIGKLGVKIRPFVKEVLDELSSKFEILIFTASNSTYADPILDLIDPDRKYITYRLYRQHCIPKGKHKLKDLRIFSNRSLKDLVIIDNSLSCFSQQIDNGILISS